MSNASSPVVAGQPWKATPAQRKAWNARYLGARRRYFYAMKLDLGCTDCGYRAHPAALDFDHRPGEEKLFGLAAWPQHGWSKALLEMLKCDLRCANCHRVRTFERRRGTEIPGQLALF